MKNNTIERDDIKNNTTEQDKVESGVIERSKVKSRTLEKGIVNCWALNVREEPRPDASIIGTVNQSSEVMVNDNESTDEFYKVCTAAGVEGFCMKKYITVQ